MKQSSKKKAQMNSKEYRQKNYTEKEQDIFKKIGRVSKRDRSILRKKTRRIRRRDRRTMRKREK